MTAFVHPSSIVDEGVELGEGVRIWHFVHVCRGARIGARSVLGQNVFVGPDVHIGAGVKIQNNVSVYTGVVVEDDVFLGPSCVFTNVYNPRAFVERKDEFRPTVVRRGASVGANATVVCGATLGAYCLVGAGAVVKDDVAPHAVVVGAPARCIGYVCRCGERLRFEGEGECGRCGDRYSIEPGSCVRLGA